MIQLTRPLKILILANSLACYDCENRWYDTEDLKPHEIYPELLSNYAYPHIVHVNAFPWMTIIDALNIVRRSQQQSIDFFILHVGIVEAVKRIYPLSWRRAINQMSSRSLKNKLNELESLLLYLPLNNDGWISPSEFDAMLRKLHSEATRKFHPHKIVLINVNQVKKTFENKHPGTNRSIMLYNKEMQVFARQTLTHLIDANQILDSQKFLSDGIHLNRLGHETLARELSNLILSLGAQPALSTVCEVA